MDSQNKTTKRSNPEASPGGHSASRLQQKCPLVSRLRSSLNLATHLMCVSPTALATRGQYSPCRALFHHLSNPIQHSSLEQHLMEAAFPDALHPLQGSTPGDLNASEISQCETAPAEEQRLAFYNPIGSISVCTQQAFPSV